MTLAQTTDARTPVPRVPTGINLRNALKVAKRLGCKVVSPRRTGEVRISHSDLPHSVTQNARRKDTVREVVDYINDLIDKLNQ